MFINNGPIPSTPSWDTHEISQLLIQTPRKQREPGLILPPLSFGSSRGKQRDDGTPVVKIKVV